MAKTQKIKHTTPHPDIQGGSPTRSKLPPPPPPLPKK